MKEPIEPVLKVAASMTQARNALRSQKYNGVESSARIAAGWVEYAVNYIDVARVALRDEGNEFPEMVVDSPVGILAQAMERLGSPGYCNNLIALGLVADAHMALRKFHKRLGYREIENDDLEPYQAIGIGGGGR